MQLAANFYPSSPSAKRRGVGGFLTLEIIEPNGLRHRMVSDRPMRDKREARKVAEENGYTPWNF